MKLNPGDMMFTRNGRPAVVVGRQSSGEAVAQRKGAAFEKARKFGFINGLLPHQREKLFEIVGKAREKPAPEDRIKMLQNQVGQLGADPQNWVLKRYLEGEMSYIMNSEGVHPHTFAFDESEI